MMRMHDLLDGVTDLASGEWTSMQELGGVVTSMYNEEVVGAVGRAPPPRGKQPCHIQYTNVPAAVRERLEPRMDGILFYSKWQPKVSLEEGVTALYRLRLDQTAATAAVAAAATADDGGDSAAHTEL
jgi:hypothetical protein